LTDQIFETYAPLYWAAGLPAIPLRERNKIPAINQWAEFGTRMPDATEQARWLASFPHGNIGLPLGAASGICVIDIDTEDEELIKAIVEACGSSPWERIGKKGMALAYRWEGQKNHKLRSADGDMICEFLGQGNQVVLPGSIHPDTGRPYTSNTNLWEVKAQLPFLGEDIEDKLRAVLGSKGFTLGAGGRSAPLEVIPAGERDVQMIRHAGYLARVVLGIDRTSKFSLYEAILHIHTWVEHFTAKVSGDAMDPNKGVAKLLEFLIKDIERGKSMPEDWDAGLPNEWREHPTIRQMAELNSSKRWTIDQVIKKFDEIVLSDNSHSCAARAVNETMELVARCPHFTKAHEVILFKHILRHTRTNGFDMRQLQSLLKEAKAKQIPDGAEDQEAIARRELEQLSRGGEIRFDHEKLWQWNGSCWVQLNKNEVYLHVAGNVKDSALVRRESDYRAVVTIIERLSAKSLVQVEHIGVNFANGVLDTDLKLVGHDPNFGATFTLPFEYNASLAGDCGNWLEFLHTCWGDEPDFNNRVLALQEMFAATLFGIATHYQRAFLLFGKAGSGKSQILNVLRAILPPDATTEVGPQKWGKQFEMTDLVGKIANICGELPERGLISGSEFKQVVEGASIRDCFKHKDHFRFKPKCAHWFASNFLPYSADTSFGLARRWAIIDFNKAVPEKRRVANFAEILVAEERDAITAWAAAGLPRLIEQGGYTLPPCHEYRLGQMRRITNSVYKFIEDSGMVRRSEGSMKCRVIFDKYQFYAKDYCSTRPVSFDQFIQMLEDLDFMVVRNTIGDYLVTGLEGVGSNNTFQ
jgi:putative DNA primase/helicase